MSDYRRDPGVPPTNRPGDRPTPVKRSNTTWYVIGAIIALLLVLWFLFGGATATNDAVTGTGTTPPGADTATTTTGTDTAPAGGAAGTATTTTTDPASTGTSSTATPGTTGTATTGTSGTATTGAAGGTTPAPAD